MVRRLATPVLFGLVLLTAPTVSAQVLGTFSWRLAPFCNVITVLVEQKGAIYQLTGTDNQCGAGVAGAVSGSAHLNPNGSVGMGFTVMRLDGIAIATSVTLNIASLAGSWSDEYGNNGDFLFNAPGAGSLRPVTMKGTFMVAFPVGTNQRDSSSIAFGKPLVAPPIPHIVPVGGPPTASCPGTAEDPMAAPGHLCLYEQTRINLNTAYVTNGALDNPGTDRHGAAIMVIGSSAGIVTFYGGRWAVTVP